MRSLRGPNNKCILSNCRLAKLSGGKKVLRVTQRSMDHKESQHMEGKDSIVLAASEQTDIPDNMVKSGTSLAQSIEKEPELNNSNIKSDVVKKETEPNNSNINNDVVEKEPVIISVVTTAPKTNSILKNENFSKNYIKPTESLDLGDQPKDVEHFLNLTKPLSTNNKEKIIPNDAELTKDMVIRFVKIMFIIILYS